MAISVNVGDNPLVATIGANIRKVTINSGRNATDHVTYKIVKRDNQQHNEGINTEIIMSSWANASNYDDVISVSATQLVIELNTRTRYKVCIKYRTVTQSVAGTWSTWKHFNTRDTRYSTPDAITQENISDDRNPTYKGNKTIVVTNEAKASVVLTARGATVINTDKVYNGTTRITNTSAGATIVNENYYCPKKSGGRGPAARQPI